jgi:hypothetical protein
MNKSLFLIAASSVLYLACRHEPPAQPKQEPVPVVAASCSPDTVYFVRDILPILQGNCAMNGCHNSQSKKDGVDLSTYQRVMATADIRPFQPEESDMYEVIMENRPDKRMPPPPSPALSLEQKAKIEKWIRQGALHNDCKSCDTLQVSFSRVISPLIQAACLGCHQQANPSGGIRLDSYDAIKAHALSGALYGSVSGQSAYVRMPFMQSALPECNQQQIKRWVEEGAPNN